MKFEQRHPHGQLPSQGSEAAGGYDIYMPYEGIITADTKMTLPLGFAAEVPEGYVALILPRSSAGAKKGVELVNTCGVIDADYRGEWIAVATLKKGFPDFTFERGDRIFQFILVPALKVTPEWVEELPTTNRGAGGFGSTGQ